MIRDEQAMRHRIEARLDERNQNVPRPAFDASVQQAQSIGVGSYQVTVRTAAGSATYSAIGDAGALADAAYAAGALGLTMMAVRP